MKKKVNAKDISFKSIPYLFAILGLVITLFYFPHFFAIYGMALIAIWYIREFFFD